MRKLLYVFTLLTIIVFQVASAYGQGSSTPATAQSKTDAGVTPNGVIGEVTTIDPAALRITVKTDAGASVNVTLNDKTSYMRLAPGEKTLKNAAKITLADVGVGDRVWARGKVSEDQKSVPALALIVMTKADIAQKQERDRAEWQRRGITGRVTALNPAGQEITVSVRGRGGEHPLTIVPASDARFRRYAPDSVKFSDAKPSSFTELKVGDQLRALGERSADGARYTAEEVVTGSFRMVGGPITEINTATGEIKINNLQTGQPLTVVVGRDSILRRLPPAMAERLAQRASGDGPNGAGAAPGNGPRRGGQQEGVGGDGGGGARPAGAGEGTGPRQRMGAGGGGGAPDFQEMFDNLPAITVAELKKGDAIIVSSTTGVDPTRVTAIRLAAGVEPILNRPQPQAQPGRQAPAPSLALPGLDTGIGFP
jgi:Cu/Ag efflux protein CusF